MNVSCPQCKTVFRVDPRKVPAEGVRARCSVCGGVFEVAAEQKAGAPRPAVTAAAPDTPPRGVTAAASAVAPAPPVPPPAAPESAETQRIDVPIRTQPEAPVARPSPAAPSAAGAARPAGLPFGQTNPEVRARRLARALISDVAAYHPERQEMGLREGRLKELFQEELKKSWQEYVDQVGIEVARSTPYFRDALNEILAKGKRVF